MAARRAAVRNSVSEPKSIRFGRGAVRLHDGVMGRSRSVRTEEEQRPAYAYHLRSQSLSQNLGQGFIDDRPQVQIEGQDSHASQYHQHASGSTSGVGSTSQHSPQHSSSPSHPSAFQTPMHSTQPSASTSHLHPSTLTFQTPRTPQFHSEEPPERSFLFYSDEGGLRSTNEFNLPMERIYYLGVIDILTPYGTLKRVEGLWKGVMAGSTGRVSTFPGQFLLDMSWFSFFGLSFPFLENIQELLADLGIFSIK